ncbi:hypothetical protein BC833DRAFT_594434 [Globomyces pollinis-pini]|nr:hypothetical protein BC833DRAFT_594434 [Globomyces pollinis-pini]
MNKVFYQLILWNSLLEFINAQCFSLQATTMCGEYKAYSIGTLNGVTNAAQFDNTFASKIAYDPDTRVCQWKARSANIFQSTSFQCGYNMYLNDVASPLHQTPPKCNANNPKPPIQLCKSSATFTLTAYKKLLEANCPKGSVFALIPSLERYVASLSDTNCYLAIGPDTALKCGLPAADGLNYCKTSPDALCCKSTSNLVAPAASVTTAGPPPVVTTGVAVAAPNAVTEPVKEDVITSAAPSATTEPSLPTTTAPKPSPTSKSNSSESQAKSDKSLGLNVSPLYVGLGGLVVALVITLLAVLMFIYSRKKGDSEYDDKPKSATKRYTEESFGNQGRNSNKFDDEYSRNSIQPYENRKSTNVEDSYQYRDSDPYRGQSMYNAEPREEVMEVVYEYRARMDDEISLAIGDHVIILEKYSDGWDLGYNKRTKQEGSFPDNCLAPIRTRNSQAYSSRQNGKSSQRRTSSAFYDDRFVSAYER